MEGVFKLRGSDVYRVESIERVPGPVLPPPPERRNLLAAVRDCARRIGRRHGPAVAPRHGARLHRGQFLRGPRADPASRRGGGRLYTVASRGYPTPAWGPRSRWTGRHRGRGPRAHAHPDRLRAGRVRLRPRDPGVGPARGARPRDRDPAAGAGRVAQPARRAHRGLRGGSSACSSWSRTRTSGFGYDDEDALVAVAGQLGTSIHVMQAAAEAEEAPAEGDAIRTPVAGPPLAVRHFAENDSIFLGRDYLIKGVAAASSTRSCRTSSPTGARSSPTGAAPRPAREAAGPERQPRGAPDPPVAPARRTRRRHPHREIGARALSPRGLAPHRAGRGRLAFTRDGCAPRSRRATPRNPAAAG